MELKNIIIEIKERIATIKINKPETLNALSTQVLRELSDAVDQINANPEVRVLIITGEGRSFVAGADISEMKSMDRSQGLEYGKFGSSVFRKIEKLPIPVIAAVNGFALGGGLELAMACDIRLASEKAKLGQPEVGLGITPGFSGTQRLTRLVGAGKAKELILTAKPIHASEALQIGLVNAVYAPEELMNQAFEMASKIASNAPVAVKLSKQAINDGAQVDIDSAIALENNLFADCFTTEDQKEGMGAFLEKREPKWRNK